VRVAAQIGSGAVGKETNRMVQALTGTKANLLLKLSVPDEAAGSRFNPSKLFLTSEQGGTFNLGKMFDYSLSNEGRPLLTGPLFECFVGGCGNLTRGESYAGIYSFYRESSLSQISQLASLFTPGANLSSTEIYIYYEGGGRRVIIPRSLQSQPSNIPSVIELPQTGSQNVGERIQVSESVEPGDVVGMDPDRPNNYRKTREPYSTFVAGIITVRPVVELGRSGKAAEGPVLALSGTAKVKVTAENGPVGPGDLLTTSSTPGYAMACRDIARCSGAIIGKALQPLESGKGKIEVLLVG